MTPLEIVQLVGYSTGAALHLWIGKLLLSKRRGALERVLLLLTVAVGLWHASNFALVLHRALGVERWSAWPRVADTVAVVSITLAYSLLLHVHLHLWANARHRAFTRFERIRVCLSYIPLLFLTIAVPPIWNGPYAPMFEKLAHLVLPFALWAAYVLFLVAGTDLLIARASREASQRRLMITLASSFIIIAALILAVYAVGVGARSPWGAYLQTMANLGSLLPTALLAYHIYRYRYLELIIERSLFVAVFAVFILLFYLYGVRAFGDWLTKAYGLREGAVEALLILALALVAVPLHRWLRGWVHELFARETEVYRDLLGKAERQRWSRERLLEFLAAAARRIEGALGVEQVAFIVPFASGDGNTGAWEAKLWERAHACDWLEADDALAERGWSAARALRWGDELLGLMLVKAHEIAPEARGALDVLAGQIALVIRDCRLIEENIALERELAHGERLAALGRMAATVAHEIKNPLAAIKAIAQVMREDESLRKEYERDLELIVGEADRLSRTLNQLLSFARRSPVAETMNRRASELVQQTIALFQAEAAQRGISLEQRIEADFVLNAQQAEAVRDALFNLVANAMQALQTSGRVRLDLVAQEKAIVFRVTDDGPGIPAHLREKIWEPFFTTRQRGTGLGLAIVRKRMEEVGGSARLVAEENGGGACFELLLPSVGPS